MNKSGKIIGIELGSENFKIVEASIKGSTVEVHGLHKQQLSCNSNDINSIFNLLESYLKKTKAQKKQIVISISRPEILELKVEYLSSGESEDQAVQKIKEKIGLQNSIEWIEDSNLTEVQDSKVLFYGRCQKLISQNLDEIIKKTNNDLLALDFSELAIGRVLDFQLDHKTTSSIRCVIDIGLKCTRINTYYNGVLLLPREIAIGGEAFTQIWCDKESLTFEEAENLKLNSLGLKEDYFECYHSSQKVDFSGSVVSPWNYEPENSFNISYEVRSNEPEYNPFQQNQPSESSWYEDKKQNDFKPYNPFEENVSEVNFEENKKTFIQSESFYTESQKKENELEEAWNTLLEELIREVKRSLDYAQSLGFMVEHLFLTGGGGLIKGLDTYISKALHINCKRLNPFENTKIRIQKLDQEKYLENSQEFSVAVGNILHTLY